MTPTADVLAGQRRPTLLRSPTLTGLAGCAVLAVVLQSSGGFAVELLGPDLMLVVAGFALTSAVLTGAGGTDWAALRAWVREQAAVRAPLLIVTITAVIAIGALVGQGDQSAATAMDAFTGLLPVGLWELTPAVGPVGRVDPLGPLWLIGLLALFGLGWPLLLGVLCARLRVTDGPRVLTRLTPVLLGAAIGTWLLGPLRAATGAGLAELAVGSHIRLTEWLAGAAAAAAVVGLQAYRSTSTPATSRTVATLLWSPRWAQALAGIGCSTLVMSAVVATWQPEPWLRHGGPGVAAFGAAAVLFALHTPGLRRSARALGHGLPQEFGRMAYPLLVLHAPLFWLVQLAVPGARPFALIVVGGALAWLIGLLIQDGLVRRWHARGTAVPRAITVGTVAVLVAGFTVAFTVPTAGLVGTGRQPVVLVLGGSTAGELAAALRGSGSGFAVADGSRPGCGLLAAPSAGGPQARTTARAQAPATAPNCGDWPRAWTARIAAVQPDVIVVDLSADTTPRGASSTVAAPCDPAFRAGYRSLLEQAVDVWTHDAAARPVLLTTARDDGTSGSVRCLNALVGEAAGSYRELAQLDVDGQLCPNESCRTYTLGGEPLLDGGTRLSRAGLAELGSWLAESITSRVGDRR